MRADGAVGSGRSRALCTLAILVYGGAGCGAASSDPADAATRDAASAADAALDAAFDAESRDAASALDAGGVHDAASCPGGIPTFSGVQLVLPTGPGAFVASWPAATGAGEVFYHLFIGRDAPPTDFAVDDALTTALSQTFSGLDQEVATYVTVKASYFGGCLDDNTVAGIADWPDRVSSDMVRITPGPPAMPFFIDRYEARILPGGDLGDADQDLDDDGIWPDTGVTPTTAIADNGWGQWPAHTLSYYQASAACRNAMKRLCTEVEWRRACAGPAGWTYPYAGGSAPRADDGGALDTDSTPGDDPTWGCNTAGTGPSGVSFTEVSGSRPGCVSAEGVHDLGGNLFEWVDTGSPDTGSRLGGASTHGPDWTTCESTWSGLPSDRHHSLGFRCCR